MFDNILTILKLIIFDIVLPTTDSYGDIMFSIKACFNNSPVIGCLMGIPVIFNIFFHASMWRTTTFDSRKEKHFTWALVLMDLWPQYQSLKVLKSIFLYLAKIKHENQSDALSLLFVDNPIKSVHCGW